MSGLDSDDGRVDVALPERPKISPSRLVALKLMYVGDRYHGFASQGPEQLTVEGELFNALERTKLLLVPRSQILTDAQYSRCGRTDKGVNAVGQVVGVRLRSRLLASTGEVADVQPPLDAAIDEEIDYVSALNRKLPPDIRVLGWSPAPQDFNARFKCVEREYRYYFPVQGLDIKAMEEAASKFVGQHDFRNFCKIDTNVQSFVRNITCCTVSGDASAPTDTARHEARSPTTSYTDAESGADCACSSTEQGVFGRGGQTGMLRVVGSAFLWHQIRCIMAVLHLVGQHLEKPEIVSQLLDTNTAFPRKPQYPMAPPEGLVLHRCEFPEGMLRFRCSAAAQRQLANHMASLAWVASLRGAVLASAASGFAETEEEEEDTDRRGNTWWHPTGVAGEKGYKPLSLRPTEGTYEEKIRKVLPSPGGPDMGAQLSLKKQKDIPSMKDELSGIDGSISLCKDERSEEVSGSEPEKNKPKFRAVKVEPFPGFYSKHFLKSHGRRIGSSVGAGSEALASPYDVYQVYAKLLASDKWDSIEIRRHTPAEKSTPVIDCICCLGPKAFQTHESGLLGGPEPTVVDESVKTSSATTVVVPVKVSQRLTLSLARELERLSSSTLDTEHVDLFLATVDPFGTIVTLKILHGVHAPDFCTSKRTSDIPSVDDVDK